MRAHECLNLRNLRWRNQRRSKARLSKIPLFDDPLSRTDNRRRRMKRCISTALIKQSKTKVWAHNLLSDSNTNVNSMINRRVSLFYRYPLKAFHHMVRPCTLDGVCVVCPGTSELVGQHLLDTTKYILWYDKDPRRSRPLLMFSYSSTLNLALPSRRDS